MLGQHVALLQPRIACRKPAVHLARPLLAITDGGEAVGCYAVGDEIAYHRLGTALRESLVVSVRANEVGMRRKLNGNVRVVVQYIDELAEGHLGTVAQRGLVEIIEDIVYQHRSRDVGERELQRGVARGLRVGERLYLLLMVEKSLARREEEVAHARRHGLRERAVALERQLLVGSVIANAIDLRLRQFVTVNLIYPTLHGLLNLRVYKRVEMIPTSRVATVA